MSSITTAAVQFALMLCARTCFAITGFGEGLIYHLGYYFCSVLSPTVFSGGVTAAGLNINFEACVTLFVQALILRKHFNFQLFIYMLPLSMVGTVTGTYILFSLNSAGLHTLKCMMGFLLLVVGLFKFYVELKKYFQESKAKSLSQAESNFSLDSFKMKAITLSASIISGVLNGLFLLPGPPFMVYVLYFAPDSVMWRATVSHIGLVTNWLRLGFLYAQDDLGAALDPVVYIGLLSGSLIGLFIGNYAANHSDPSLFRRCVLAILIVGSISMISSNVSASFIVALLLIVSAAMPTMCWCVQAKVGGSDDPKPALLKEHTFSSYSSDSTSSDLCYGEYDEESPRATVPAATSK